MSNEVHRIRDPSQLADLSVRRLLSRRPPTRIEIEAIGTSTERVRAWEQRISQLQGACGCEQGGIGLIAGLVGYAAFLLLRPGGWGDVGSTELWVGVAVLFITATLGKVVGLRMARRGLQRAVREIRAQWAAQNANGRETYPKTTQDAHRRILPSMCCGRTLPLPPGRD